MKHTMTFGKGSVLALVTVLLLAFLIAEKVIPEVSSFASASLAGVAVWLVLTVQARPGGLDEYSPLVVFIVLQVGSIILTTLIYLSLPGTAFVDTWLWTFTIAYVAVAAFCHLAENSVLVGIKKPAPAAEVSEHMPQPE